MKVSVTNFWAGAFENDFFSYLLNLASEGRHAIVSNPDEADVCFSSVFGSQTTPVERTIAYLGENVRPNFSQCRFALSFDIDPWGGRNFYLPLWYARLAWPGFEQGRGDRTALHGNETLIPLEALTAGRSLAERPDPESSVARKFCAIVASAPENFRINAFLFLSAYKPVDGFGMLFGAPLYQSKFDVLRDYKFCLCPENSLFPGYVTEKLFDAYYAGCVPLYFGDLSASAEINRGACINYADFHNMENFMHQILAADANPDVYQAYYAQPLLRIAPSLVGAVTFLRDAIRAILAR